MGWLDVMSSVFSFQWSLCGSRARFCVFHMLLIGAFVLDKYILRVGYFDAWGTCMRVVYVNVTPAGRRFCCYLGFLMRLGA